MTDKKDDIGKTRFDLLEPNFEESIAKVLTFGSMKYGANTWQTISDPVNRYYGALRRHINAWRAGEKIDKETGLSHLALAACNIMFLMHFEEEKTNE